jgi:hypothetical protein
MSEQDGTLAPEDVHVEGVPTAEELAAEAAKVRMRSI